jgi:ribosomal protein S18 acetylase RimI-like enzyme
MAAITTRPARYTDFEAVSALLTDFLRQHHAWRPEFVRGEPMGFTEAIFQTWLDEPNTLYLVAEKNHVVVGYASANRWQSTGSVFNYAEKGAHIGLISVSPAHQRQGVGRALFKTIEQWADDFGAEHVGLSVNDLNAAAKAFYESVGYCVSNEYRVKTLRRIQRFASPPAATARD